MSLIHRLECTASSGGLLLECKDGCGRRLVVDRRCGDLTVIDRGDPLSLHCGDIGDVRLGLPTILLR